MGKSVTPTYRIEFRAHGFNADIISRVDRKPASTMCWNGKRHGKASAANLETWRQTMNKSFQPGGTNSHLASGVGVVPHIYYARIVRQSNNEAVAETRAPMFEVV